ncbi:hypothetical protein ACT2CV_04300 [Pasteurellaceae bacterium 22721_9_1]
MKKLILTALDDNDEIWYRCFIPFILSLRKTDYLGDIGVISYQLSLEKQQILKANNIIVFEAKHQFSEMLVDRHFSAAEIAQDYDQLAFYDADIWFPYPKLTVFDQIRDNHSLYCCYDVIIPPFLEEPLPDKISESTRLKFNRLLSSQNAFWQAGLIIGSNQAWNNYFHYIKQDLLCLSEFKMVYGIDATILNLYACDKNNVKHISEKYNCLPYWGISFVGLNYFKLNDNTVESVHITRYHRDSKEYNYIHLNKSIYLSRGKDFSIDAPKMLHYFQCGHLFSSLPQNTNFPVLSIEEIYCTSLFANTDTDGKFYKKDSVILDCSANAKIALRNPLNQEIEILFYFQEKPNSVLPCHIEFKQNDKQLNLERNTLYTISLLPYDHLELITNDIWQNRCGIRYIFNNVRFI